MVAAAWQLRVVKFGCALARAKAVKSESNESDIGISSLESLGKAGNNESQAGVCKARDVMEDRQLSCVP